MMKTQLDMSSIQKEIDSLEYYCDIGDLVKELLSASDILAQTETDADLEREELEEEERLWAVLEAKQLQVRSRVAQTSFQLQLSVARGHIDIERLQKALNTVRNLESQHLAEEDGLVELRAATIAVQEVSSKQQGAELAGQLESTIVSYNGVCSSLLGTYQLSPFITSSPYLPRPRDPV